VDCVAELVLDRRAELLEGPWWDHNVGELVFVSILEGLVCRYDVRSRCVGEQAVGQPVGAAVRRESGGLILALRDGIATLDASGRVGIVAGIERDLKTNRLNEAKCDAAGRLWVGSMAFDTAKGAGSLYRVEPDFTYRRIISKVTIPNGMGWTSDNSTMYHIDSRTRRVDTYRYNVNTGDISDRNTFVQLSEGEGEPDGLLVDAEDFVWIATFGGGCVRRYAPDGRLDGVVSVPATKVTSCAFGGPALDQLFITTAAIDLDHEQRTRQPHAGGLFWCKPGVAGRCDFAFAG
jgi:sugar lactone lactonase YvrE